MELEPKAPQLMSGKMQIIIPGDPIAKTRHRSFIRNGHISTYDDQIILKCNVMKQMIAMRENWIHKEEALKVDLIFQLDAQKGSSKAESTLRQWSSHFPIFGAMATKKIDLDNLCKTYLDCGNGILWSDDRYIVQLSSRKEYSKNPCTIINVETINEVKMSDAHEKVFKTFSPSDVEVMAADAERIFMAIPPNYQDNSQYESQMAAAAELLIDFADEWCDKLRKIKRK